MQAHAVLLRVTPALLVMAEQSKQLDPETMEVLGLQMHA